jgi:formylglycine-generating enzyme required for sulfatase activity
MVRIKGFCIDRYEAHLALIREGQPPEPHPHSVRPEKGQRYLAVSKPGVFPQAYVNRPEAASACANAGKRLCTVGEWYRACIGPRGWPFPYGVSEQPAVCNTRKPHLLSLRFGIDPQAWKYDEHFNAPELDQEPGFLAKAGEYTGCASPEGVYDLVGNLHEWVSDAVGPTLSERLPLLPGIHRKLYRNWGHGIFMGGFFSTGSEHGRGCAFVTIGHEPRYHDYSTGFRCCRDVSP